MKVKSQSFCLKLSLNLLCFYFLGCSSLNEKRINSFDIPKEAQANFDLTEIAKSIEYIALETTDESFLSLIQEIRFFKDKFYVVDFPGKILVFDANGKFLHQIGAEGDGPGEFFNLSSFVIDGKSERLHLASGRRLITYTLDNEFVGEQSFPFFIDYVELVGDHLSLIAGNDGVRAGGKFVNQRSLFKVSPEMDIVDSIPLIHIEMNKETGATFPYKHFISKVDGNDFIYTPVLTNESIIRDTLFEIDDTSFMPVLKLDFASPLFNKEGEKLILIKNVVLSKKFVVCEYDREGGRALFIGSRDSDFSVNLDEGVLIENGEHVILRPLDLDKDQFYFLKQHDFSETLTEELNPIIGIVKL